MRILVYGAGVIGCELAHMLVKAGNDVTLLARGAWKNTLEQNGLVIRHYAQLCTTTDRVRVIDALPPHYLYDLIFIVMQYGQLPDVLPAVAQNRSRYVVLVGNNPDAETALEVLTVHDSGREVAFGFQGTAGRRENGKVISIHAGVGMTVGAFQGRLSSAFQERLERAFDGVKYRLSWEENMDAWLKCHLALILPVSYVCYAVDCRLSKASRAQRKAILDAALEGCVMLRGLGVPIRTQDSEDYFRPGKKRRKMAAVLYIMAKTPLGRLAASDHCRHAALEMRALDAAFEKLRQKAGVPMPVWEQLRTQPGVIGAFTSAAEGRKS
ncbi:Ketopantoate reductase PanE/ApbA [uncultured Eubacteriales bacterium]|uniref:Ketopantoate reductase PanE/ApbA n=1 Tax=uncultured Eubacteriales bacterium TaxID=172733 RepID=A0A212JDJ6_9FIRM|nr:Ketopantoate reductase PanE/ApbA [uncultured Eubacteriales bacterium]